MIACELYDYVEIACMYRYPINLVLKSGERVQCVALDTARNDQGEECIKVDIDGTVSLVVLDDISVLEARIDNPHFKSVSFH